MEERGDHHNTTVNNTPCGTRYHILICFNTSTNGEVGDSAEKGCQQFETGCQVFLHAFKGSTWATICLHKRVLVPSFRSFPT